MCVMCMCIRVQCRIETEEEREEKRKRGSFRMGYLIIHEGKEADKQSRLRLDWQSRFWDQREIFQNRLYTPIPFQLHLEEMYYT